jgi:hypothetical protein
MCVTPGRPVGDQLRQLKGTIMNMRAIAAKAVVAATLSTALLGIGSGVASAKPDQAWCDQLFMAYTSSDQLAAAAYQRGDMKEYRYWDYVGNRQADLYQKRGCT